MPPKEFDHKEFIQNEQRWPNWPILPMKRLPKERKFGEFPELGVMLATRKTVVYLVDLYRLPQTPEGWKKAEQKNYNTLDELLNDGWIVD